LKSSFGAFKSAYAEANLQQVLLINQLANGKADSLSELDPYYTANETKNMSITTQETLKECKDPFPNGTAAL